MPEAATEWEWDALSAAALEAYRAARRDEAVHLWRRAAALAGDFPEGDPRRAASGNNSALAFLIDQDLGGAVLTRFNLAIARLFLDEDETADALLAAALAEREQAFGPNNAEVIEIARVLSGRADAAEDDDRMSLHDARIEAAAGNRARDVLDIWRGEQPLEMNDTRRLLGAGYLTAMVHERDFL